MSWWIGSRLGHHDTVPRTLDAGAFVIRKAGAEVRRRRAGASGQWRGRFRGRRRACRLGGNGRPGTVRMANPARRKEPGGGRGAEDDRPRPAGMNEYTGWLQWNYGASVSPGHAQQDDGELRQAGPAGSACAGGLHRAARRSPATSARTWAHQADVAAGDGQPLLWGKDLERELIDYMEQNQGEFYRRGGLSKSDTVPAMLTPGEFVVNRDAVARYGAGFFGRSTTCRSGAALAGRVLAGVQGSPPAVWCNHRVGLPRPALANRWRPAHRCAWNCPRAPEGQRHRRCATSRVCCNCWTPPAPGRLPEGFRCS